jgi:hypothetical protein
MYESDRAINHSPGRKDGNDQTLVRSRDDELSGGRGGSVESGDGGDEEGHGQDSRDVTGVVAKEDTTEGGKDTHD